MNGITFMKEVQDCNVQRGKIDALLSEAINGKQTIDEAIRMARKARGHVAVILKRLNEAKRKGA